MPSGDGLPSTRAYYEDYWGKDTAPPDDDPLTEARVRRFLEVGRDARFVLDLGCGNGRGTQLLREGGKQAVGLDISRRALIRARQNGGKIPYLQGACDAPLPFASDSFDAVYSAEVVEHLLEPEAMIRECRRILKPGGVLFASTPFHGLVKNLVVAAAGFDRHFNPAGPHIRFFSVKSLSEMLSRSGFHVEGVFYFGRFWPLWMNMAIYARKL